MTSPSSSTSGSPKRERKRVRRQYATVASVQQPPSGPAVAIQRLQPEASTSGRGHSIVCAAVPAQVQAAQVQAAAQPKAAKKTAAPAAPIAGDQDGMWMIVGLGNPGKNYERTRHNVGFMLVDELARLEGIECKKLEKSAAVGKGEMAGKQVLLVKPVTFMNNSGESVAALARFYKVPTGRVLVVSDDLDMPTGQVRLRARGGHGGHNGLRSIVERFGNSQEFPRLKIGIGRPSGELPIATYVLQDFSKREQSEIDVAVQECVDVVRSVLSLGLTKALSGVRS